MRQKIFFTLIASLAFLCVFQQSVFAGKYPFKNYSGNDGLSNSYVLSILQDSRGYLWFGTDGGAIKFDGVKFTAYTKTHGLAGNRVYSMIEDRERNLWFGTDGTGVSRFDGKTWKTFTKEHGLADNTVVSMLEDSGGDLWFATTEGGVCKFDGERWITYTAEDGLGDNQVHTIIQSSDGYIWIGTQAGACRFDGEGWESYTTEHGMSRNIVSILEDGHGDIWFSGERKAEARGPVRPVVIKVTGEPGRGEFTAFTTEDGLPAEIAGSMLEDGQGNIWIGTKGAGLGMFDGREWKVFTTKNGLPKNYIESMLEDRGGNLWFGTRGGGVSRLGSTAFTVFTTEDGLADNTAAPRFEDSRENLWFSPRQAKGLIRYDGEDWIHYTTENGLGSDEVSDMFEDSDGIIWCATRMGGLSKFDGKKWSTYDRIGWVQDIYLEDEEGNLWLGDGRSTIKFDRESSRAYKIKEGLVSAIVFSALKDKNGDLWFAGDAGITRFDGEKWWPDISANINGISLSGVRQIFEDRSGGLWFLTSRGLTRFDGEKWKNYTTENGLAHNDVLSIFEDNSGALWIGTNGGGVSRLDSDRFTNYTKNDGLSSNYCYFTAQDNSYYYFVTDKGLDRFDGRAFRSYAEKDGLADSRLEGYLMDSRGNLWFGSAQGVTKYNPGLDRACPVSPPVYITRLRVLEQDTTVTSGLRLGYRENSLRFDYVGLCFKSPEDVLYSYKLEGLEKDWQETYACFVSYPDLNPGYYVFKVRARNREGVWSEENAQISFQIRQPFWVTVWFKSVITAIALLSLWGLYIVKTWNMQKRNVELERKVEERTRELREKTAQLIQAEKMASLGHLVAGVAHEINTPLGALKSNNDTFFRNIKDIKNIFAGPQATRETGEGTQLDKLFANTEKLNSVSMKAIERISTIVRSLCTFARIDKAVRDKVDIHEGLKTTLTLVQHEISKRIKLHTDYADLPKITCFPDRLNQVFMNLMINAIQAIEGEGEISVRTYREKDWMVVEIRDTGRGIAEEEMEHIFDPGFTTKGVGVGTGLGLSIVYQIVQEHEGKVEVDSEPGKGSTFRVYLPVK